MVTAYLVDTGQLDPRTALQKLTDLAHLAGLRAKEGTVDITSEAYTLRLSVLTGIALFGQALWYSRKKEDAMTLFRWLLQGWAYPDADPEGFTHKHQAQHSAGASKCSHSRSASL